MSKKVKVINSIMGSGKTSWAIQKMNNEDGKYIFITPYLTEIERVKDSITSKRFYEPNEKLGEGSKFRHFKKMLKQGKNIVSTHSLFSLMDTEAKLALKEHGYTLILDEVFQVVDKLNVSVSDAETILDKYVAVGEDGRVKWTDFSYIGEFDHIRKRCENETVYTYGGKFFFWTFPSSVFELFEESYILTYLFDGQIQKYYYDMFGIEYEYYGVEKDKNNIYSLKEYNGLNEDRSFIKDLINIYEGKMNNNYFVKENKYKTELSSTWFKKSEDVVIEQMKNNLGNFVKNICKVKAKHVIWTSKKDFKPKLKGKGYGTRFLPMNIRATNDYKEASCVMYVYNRYMNPIEEGFFSKRNIKVNQDVLAVSDLLQFIWRSRIREGKPIDLYIPSRRMRDLLNMYLNNEM